MKDQQILVPLDKSPISAHTVNALIAMKDRLSGSLTLLHILDLGMLSILGFPDTTRADFEHRVRQEAVQFIAAQQEHFTSAGIPVTTLIKEGHARETICALAGNGTYDLLVIGRNPVSEIRDLLFGQVSNFVVHQAKCPVLVI
ncbi:MAG: universal stress protein [Geopsychrobacter sp.]|nr:universal stress protein [Geopsychrobacter sp.]